ncbi:MAG: glycogen-binding domain-containing protein [Gemmatimonadota bacterium]|nr:glycogen-binding domain-containing protein [Gemmatimonadota bacterium]
MSRRAAAVARRAAALGLVVAGAAAAGAVPACAQGTALTLEVGGSHSIPPGGSSASSTSYALAGLRLEAALAARSYAFAAVTGGLAADEDGSDWASILAGAGTSVPLGGPFHLDLAASGEAFTVGDPFPYRAIVGEAEPALRLALGAGSLRLAGWGGVGRSEADVVDEFEFRSRRGIVRVESGTTLTGDLWSVGGRLEYRYRGKGWEPWARLEAYDAPQGSYAGGRVGVRFTVAPLDGGVELGAWDTPDGGEVAVTARLGVAIGRDARIRVDGGRYGPDPLLDTRAAGNGGAVLSWTVARSAPPVPALPDVGDGPRIEPGDPAFVTFTFRAPEAARVAVAGGFTGWEEVPLRPEDGTWSVRLPVEPGLWRYGFVVDGTWRVPDDVADADIFRDEWGLAQATLLVPGPAGP